MEISECFMSLLLVIIITLLSACYVSGTVLSMKNPKSFVEFSYYPHFTKKKDTSKVFT